VVPDCIKNPGGNIRLVLSALVLAFVWAGTGKASRPNWQRKEVDWHLSGGQRIRAINYPPEKPVPTLAEKKTQKPSPIRKQVRPVGPAISTQTAVQEQTTIVAYLIDSPPIDGFVPWVVISVTDEAAWDPVTDYMAYPENTVVGNYLPDVNSQTDYAIGIFDTGASAHLFSVAEAVRTGIYGAGLVTSNPVELIGATGTVTGRASWPVAVFIDSIDAIDPDGRLTDTSGMIGESNVSLIVGDPVDSPNVPTAIGDPLSVYFAASFRNDKEVTVIRDANVYSSPDIDFYEITDPCLPSYSNRINLELRPQDGSIVAFFPCVEIWPGDCDPDGEGAPQLPSTIWGFLPTQSLFFFPQVNLANAGEELNQMDNFMFDTGAQVTVINETVAAGLRLDLNDPDFVVEIVDAAGNVTDVNGFYLDSVEIPASSEWLDYANVPVIVMNVSSPEGGILDGIIGMNLFVDFNFVFSGGAFQGPTHLPYLELEPVCRIAGDIAPEYIDCVVDALDLEELANAWLATSDPTPSANWNPRADLVPDANGVINFFDYCILAENWLESAP